MFRAGLSGTNWTGKTETIKRFVKEHSELTIKTVSLSSLVDRCPFPMRKDQTVEASRWMVDQVRSICEQDGAEIQLFDRTPVDILAFTLYAEDRKGRNNTTVLEDALELVKYFDIIFYLPVSNEWPVNWSPSKNGIKFSRQMDTYIQKAIDQFALDVVSLPWDRAERQRLLSEHLSGLLIACKGRR